MRRPHIYYLFFFNDTATTEIYTLSLHDALPIFYLFLMHKMTGEMVLAAVLTTISLGILVRGLVVLVFSAQQQYPLQALGFANPSLTLPGGARISAVIALLVVITLSVYAGPFLFLRLGRWGVRMRAAGQNPRLAAQPRIDPHATHALASR